MFDDCCVVSFGNKYWYTDGVKRLRKSLELVGYDGGVLTRSEYPEGCPTEEEARKAYKPYLLKEAAAQGYRKLLWLDASVWAIRPVDKIFDMIRRVGWYLVDESWNTGQWTTDASLESLCITREESWNIWHLASGIVGISMDSEKGRVFLDEWFRMANDGKSFVGPRWSPSVEKPGHGEVGFCSDDPRVLGHRADQTAASVISWKLGMLPTVKKTNYGYVSWDRKKPPQNTILIANGGVRDDDLKGVPYG